VKKIILAVITIVFYTCAYCRQPTLQPGGSWTFRSDHYAANKFLRHHESTTVYDTTQRYSPRFIIDFHERIPAVSGTYRVIKGQPMAADEIDIGVGVMSLTGLSYYSTTGGNGKETINVTVADGKMNISGAGIELANQKAPSDKSTLSFDITIRQ